MLLIERLDTLFSDSIKGGNKVRLDTLRMIKSELTKKFKEKPSDYNETVENKVLTKMVETYKKSIDEFRNCGRTDLVCETTDQLNIIKEFAPKEVSEEEIAEHTKTVISTYLANKGGDYKLSMADMKPIMIEVQKAIPSAKGGTISKILREML